MSKWNASAVVAAFWEEEEEHKYVCCLPGSLFCVANCVTTIHCTDHKCHTGFILAGRHTRTGSHFTAQVASPDCPLALCLFVIILQSKSHLLSSHFVAIRASVDTVSPLFLTLSCCSFRFNFPTTTAKLDFHCKEGKTGGNGKLSCLCCRCRCNHLLENDF